MTSTFPTDAPISLYGSSKLAAEVVALEYAQVWINRCGVLAGAGQFGTPEQGVFAYWLNAHLRHRTLRYIGFDGTGYQVRDALHPAGLAELIARQISTTHSSGTRIATVGRGPANAMPLAQLTDWCNERFGSHAATPDPRPRSYDVPWIVMDASDVVRDFGWRVQIGLPKILEEIADHAERHPEWLLLSGT